MSNFLYCPPFENQAPTGTWTASPGLASGYLAPWVADSRPERPSRLSAQNGYWNCDFGSAKRVDVIAILGHTLSDGCTVTLTAGATNGATTINHAITVPTARRDGLTRPFYLVITGVSGYSVSGYRYWRVTVSGNAATTCQVGEIWLGRVMTALPNGIGRGAERAEQRLDVVHLTNRGVRLRYDRGVCLRQISATVLVTSTAQLTAVQDWHQSAKAGLLPSLIVTDDTDRTDVRMAVFDEQRQSYMRRTMGVHELTLAMTELPVAV